MGTDAARQADLSEIIDAALRSELTREQADRTNGLGRESANAVMLAASARLAALSRAGGRGEAAQSRHL